MAKYAKLGYPFYTNGNEITYKEIKNSTKRDTLIFVASLLFTFGVKGSCDNFPQTDPPVIERNLNNSNE